MFFVKDIVHAGFEPMQDCSTGFGIDCSNHSSIRDIVCYLIQTQCLSLRFGNAHENSRTPK